MVWTHYAFHVYGIAQDKWMQNISSQCVQDLWAMCCDRLDRFACETCNLNVSSKERRNGRANRSKKKMPTFRRRKKQLIWIVLFFSAAAAATAATTGRGRASKFSSKARIFHIYRVGIVCVGFVSNVFETAQRSTVNCFQRFSQLAFRISFHSAQSDRLSRGIQLFPLAACHENPNPFIRYRSTCRARKRVFFLDLYVDRERFFFLGVWR